MFALSRENEGSPKSVGVCQGDGHDSIALHTHRVTKRESRLIQQIALDKETIVRLRLDRNLLVELDEDAQSCDFEIIVAKELVLMTEFDLSFGCLGGSYRLNDAFGRPVHSNLVPDRV